MTLCCWSGEEVGTGDLKVERRENLSVGIKAPRIV